LRSFAELDLDLFDLRHHATVAVEVWIRPCDSVPGTRWTRCVPASHLKIEYAVALDRETTSGSRLTRCRSLRAARRQAAALGVARQHPEDVGRPERRLVAADALADLRSRPAVGGVVLDERELQPPRERPGAPQLGDHP
jgi:hypothetical protein